MIIVLAVSGFAGGVPLAQLLHVTRYLYLSHPPCTKLQYGNTNVNVAVMAPTASGQAI